MICIFAVTVFFLEAFIHWNRGFWHILSNAFLGLLKNPLILASIVGILLSIFDIKLRVGFEQYIEYFESSLTPVALFAIGLQVDVRNFLRNFLDTIFLSIVKLIIMPLIALYLVWQFDVSHFWAISIVIIAALPAAKSVAIISTVYTKDQKVHKRISEVIASTTLLSIVTLLGWFLILSYVYPEEVQSLLSK